jgi:seryl-tRNA synthetase
MLELRFIRENLDLVKEKLAFRGITDSRIDDFAAIDQKRRAMLSEVEGLRNKRKTASQEIGTLKKRGDARRSWPRYVRWRRIRRNRSGRSGGGLQNVMTLPNLRDSVPKGSDDGQPGNQTLGHTAAIRVYSQTAP